MKGSPVSSVSVADQVPAQVSSQHSQHRRHTCLVSKTLHLVEVKGKAILGLSFVLTSQAPQDVVVMIWPLLASAGGQSTRQGCLWNNKEISSVLTTLNKGQAPYAVNHHCHTPSLPPGLHLLFPVVI